MRIEIYRRLRLSGWRWGWRALSANGQVVATDGGQGYSRRIDLIKSLAALQKDFALADLIAIGGAAS